MISSILRGSIDSFPQTLQVALAVLLRSKSLINQFHKFGVCCSYDEYLHFKSSAAVAANQDDMTMGLSKSAKGLVQVVADNFDANISSPNGLVSTHGLAMIVTQPEDEDCHDKCPIKRLSKSDASQGSASEVDVIEGLRNHLCRNQQHYTRHCH